MEKGNPPFVSRTGSELAKLIDGVSVHGNRFPRALLNGVITRWQPYSSIWHKLMTEMRKTRNMLGDPRVLARISSPVLVVWGDSDRRLLPEGMHVLER